jgi:hypothetical protein
MGKDSYLPATIKEIASPFFATLVYILKGTEAIASVAL